MTYTKILRMIIRGLRQIASNCSGGGSLCGNDDRSF